MDWLEGVLNEILMGQDMGSQDMGPEPAPCVIYPCGPMKAVQVPCDVKNCLEGKLSGNPRLCSLIDRLVDYVDSLRVYKALLAESQSKLAELNSSIDAIEAILQELGCTEFYQGNDGPGTGPQFDKEAEVHPVCAAYYKSLYRLEALREQTQNQIEAALQAIDTTESIISSFRQAYTNIINSAAEECRYENQGVGPTKLAEKESLDQETV